MVKIFVKVTIGLLLLIAYKGQCQNTSLDNWKFDKTWGTYDTRSVLNFVYLEENKSVGVSIGLHKLSKNEEVYLTEALIGRRAKGSEVVKPIFNILGTYTEQEISWQGASFKVQTCGIASSLLIKITCLTQTKLPVHPTYEAINFWSRGYQLPSILIQKGNDRSVTNHPHGGAAIELIIAQGETAELIVTLDNSINYTTLNNNLNKQESLAREKLASETDSVKAIIANNLGWNTIYDPTKKRIITTVNRLWNVDRGGYVIFCWDNFFGSILWSKVSEAAAIANFRNTLQEMTPDGFIPNNSQGNGRAAWDRSQPPVGTIALDQMIDIRDVAKLKQLEPEIKQLIRWNNWWWANRKNGPLLSWGSKEGSVPNKFFDKAWNNRLAAALESGADDSPAYDDVSFDTTTGLLDMHDVALNSLYVRDCELLASIAKHLGWKEEVQQLNKRRNAISTELQKLWDEKAGIYKNRHVKGDSLSSIITPFNFLPLIAKLPTDKQANKMAKSWLTNPAHFGGPYPLPSVDKQHPDYPKQQYWKGATWPPMNYLVWLGLSRYPTLKQEANWLGQSSKALFMNEYNRKGYVCENYSNVSGTCDDGLVKAETNYFWGLLMLIMK